MTDHIICEEHLQHNFRKLYQFLTGLPLKTYVENAHLHAAIRESPLQAFLIGREITDADYKRRVKPWVEEAIRNSPYLNN